MVEGCHRMVRESSIDPLSPLSFRVTLLGKSALGHAEMLHCLLSLLLQAMDHVKGPPSSSRTLQGLPAAMPLLVLLLLLYASMDFVAAGVGPLYLRSPAGANVRTTRVGA